MRRTFIAVLAVLLALTSSGAGLALRAQGENQNGQVLSRPQGHRRRVRGDVRRGPHRGIGRAFGKAGRSAGRGGRRFGRWMARGRPVRAGGELGRGMGGFGKHTGQGLGRTGRRVGHVTRRALTP